MFYKLFNSIDLFQSEKKKKRRASKRGVRDIIIDKDGLYICSKRKKKRKRLTYRSIFLLQLLKLK